MDNGLLEPYITSALRLTQTVLASDIAKAGDDATTAYHAGFMSEPEYRGLMDELAATVRQLGEMHAKLSEIAGAISMRLDGCAPTARDDEWPSSF